MQVSLTRWSRFLQRRTLSAAVLLGVAVTVGSWGCSKQAEGQKATDSTNVSAVAREGYLGNADTWPNHEKLMMKPAPPLAFTDWMNGQVTPEQMKGKIVVVDFWATWCPPCLAAIPHNKLVVQKYADKGVILIGACGGGGEEEMPARVKEHGIDYPVAKVNEATTEAWQVQYWPTYAVIDRKGDVRAIGIQPQYVEKIVDLLLKEQPAGK